MKYIIVAFLAVVMSFTVLHVVHAETFGVTLPNPLCLSGGGSECINDFPTLMTKIAHFLTGLIASLATIMFVYAGILFVTAGGNPSNAEKAKKATIYAVIGVAVALAGEGLLAVITAIVGA